MTEEDTATVSLPVNTLAFDNSVFSDDANNWQASRNSVRERLAVLCNNELISDVHFAVGKPGNAKKIPAHKIILAAGSPVFHSMFFGELSEKKDEIEITDVEPSAFLVLLKYLYCDDIQLDMDNVIATLYAADKYLVPFLTKSCIDYLASILDEENVCWIISHIRLFNIPDLELKCWRLIDIQAEYVFQTKGFTDIDSNTLENILKRETLRCNEEVIIFKGVINWAAAECARRELESTPQNQRAVLGNLLHLIRIPTITLQEMADTIISTGIFNLKEAYDLLLHKSSENNKPFLKFPSTCRTGLKYQVCRRFHPLSCYSFNTDNSQQNNILFSVNKKIFINGYGLFGSSSAGVNYKVKIELKLLDNVLASNDINLMSDGTENIFHVFFKHPIQIEPNYKYTASVGYPVSKIVYHSNNGLKEVTTSDIKFQFFTFQNSGYTTYCKGQIPEIIFYVIK